jgi:hypothetical protein
MAQDTDKDPDDETTQDETAVQLPERDAMSMVAGPVPFDDPTVPYSESSSEPTDERVPPGV